MRREPVLSNHRAKQRAWGVGSKPGPHAVTEPLDPAIPDTNALSSVG